MSYQELLHQIDSQKHEMDFSVLRSKYIFCSESLSGLHAAFEEVDGLLTAGRLPASLTEEDAHALIGHGMAFDAALQLATASTPVTEELLQELHRLLLMDSDNSGTYRECELDVPFAAAPEDIEHLMRHFIDQMTSSAYLHPVEYAAMCHKRICDIRPWRSGNGKMARLLMSYALIRAGLPPACIGPEQAKEYYESLHVLQSDYAVDDFIVLLAGNILNTLRQDRADGGAL